MAKYTPMMSYFECSKKWNKIHKYLFLISLVTSICLSLLSHEIYVDYISIFAIVLLLAIERISKNYKSRAEWERRKDFIDNSLGSKYVHNSSEDYYDNGEYACGLKKMALNLFENTFFSVEISKKMHGINLVTNLFLFSIILIFAISGVLNEVFALAVLQLFLSKYFLLNIIDNYRFRNITGDIFDDMKEVNNELSRNLKLEDSEIKLLKGIIEYEALIAETNIQLNDNIFNKFNGSLTNEWEEVKEKYGGKK
jgi:hypothetical protein